MDARLTTLIAALESGAPCIPINLLVGQWIVQGTPVGSTEFLTRTHQSLGRIAVDQMPGRERRMVQDGKADHIWQAVMAQTVGMLGPIAEGAVGPENALSLVDVTMTGGLSGVVRTTAVRVPVASVDAWWIADFKHEPANFGGGGGMSIGF